MYGTVNWINASEDVPKVLGEEIWGMEEGWSCLLRVGWGLSGVWVGFGWGLSGVWVGFGWGLGGVWVGFEWGLGGV